MKGCAVKHAYPWKRNLGIGEDNQVAIKLLRKTARKICHRLGIMTDWEVLVRNDVVGEEQPHQWYDEIMTGDSYRTHYTESCYYFMWSVITDRILRDGARSVLEIGCGPGQLAQLLDDQGILHYTGLDFSPKTVDLARRRVPKLRFVVGDARTSDIYDQFNHEVIICTEVLEHIEDDLLVVSRFGKGKRCLCTVPNFPFESHVRHFEDAREVSSRYGRFFSSFSVATMKGSRTPTEAFFLIDGIRNSEIAV